MTTETKVEAVAWILYADHLPINCLFSKETAQSITGMYGENIRIEPVCPKSALDALRGEVEAAERRVAELEAALRPLADATFAEFCDESTEEMEPDDSKVSYPEDRCHITFGMIRNALNALTKESP